MDGRETTCPDDECRFLHNFKNAQSGCTIQNWFVISHFYFAQCNFEIVWICKVWGIHTHTYEQSVHFGQMYMRPVYMDNFKSVSNQFIKKATWSWFLAAITHSRLNCSYVSWEGGLLNGKQQVLWLSYLKPWPRNWRSRMERVEWFHEIQRRHSLRVTHGICGILTYDPLWSIHLVKGEKQQLVERIVLLFSRGENRFAASYSIN